MAAISKDDENLIQSHPLASTLDPLRSSFQSRVEETSSTSSDETTDLSVTRDAISTLILHLTGHPTAKKLKSSSRRPVDAELGTLYGQIRSGDSDLSAFDSLTTAVANNASDLDIWKAVLQLISNLSRVTPPPSKSIPPSFNGTPFTRSSASQQGSDQTRRDLRPIIREELDGRTFVNTDGFWVKYFEGKWWNSRCDAIYKSLLEKYNNNVLREYPAEHVEEKIWKWLQEFQRDYLGLPQEDAGSPGCTSEPHPILDLAPGKYFRTTTAHEFVDGQSKRQLDIFLKHRSVPTNKTHSWRDVLVIGELTKSSQKNTSGEKFLQLAIYVREVFAAQPIRRFVHGFLIFANEIQLWVFDRSGAYSCDTFNIHEQPERFICAIAGYALMSDEELGLDTFVQRDDQRVTISIEDAKTSQDRIMEIIPHPFTTQKVIVSRGTACYHTGDGKNVVKFSWRDADRCSEPELLKAASSVAGLAELVGSRELSSTNGLRNGLDFSASKGVKPKKFRRADTQKLGPANLSFSSNPLELVTMTISGTKRSQEFADDEETNTSKKVRPSSLHQGIAQNDVTKLQAQSVRPRAPFRNRILTCLAISPAGRPLREFESVQDFLTGMRDAIKGHKALFIDGRVLHRDISENNIILTDPEKNKGFSGMLIDLDMAVKVGDDGKTEQTRARQRTGTLDCMALEVLEGWLDEKTAGIEHTYRHDLESFFYVLLKMCIRYGWGEQKRPSIDPLSMWYTGEPENIYSTKRGHMEAGGFELVILSKFSPAFQCLTEFARTLRGILFSKGALFTGTPENPEELYAPLVDAFNEAIQALEWTQESQDTTTVRKTCDGPEVPSNSKRKVNEDTLEQKRQKVS